MMKRDATTSRSKQETIEVVSDAEEGTSIDRRMHFGRSDSSRADDSVSTPASGHELLNAAEEVELQRTSKKKWLKFAKGAMKQLLFKADPRDAAKDLLANYDSYSRVDFSNRCLALGYDLRPLLGNLRVDMEWGPRQPKRAKYFTELRSRESSKMESPASGGTKNKKVYGVNRSANKLRDVDLETSFPFQEKEPEDFDDINNCSDDSDFEKPHSNGCARKLSMNKVFNENLKEEERDIKGGKKKKFEHSSRCTSAKKVNDEDLLKDEDDVLPDVQSPSDNENDDSFLNNPYALAKPDLRKCFKMNKEAFVLTMAKHFGVSRNHVVHYCEPWECALCHLGVFLTLDDAERAKEAYKNKLRKTETVEADGVDAHGFKVDLFIMRVPLFSEQASTKSLVGRFPKARK